MTQSKKINLYSRKLNSICYAAVFDSDSQGKVRKVKGSKFFLD